MFAQTTRFSCLMAVVILVQCIALPHVSAATWYVKWDVSSGDGTSWGTAFDTIVEGIDAASDGDTVLVADGIYVGSGNCELTI